MFQSEILAIVLTYAPCFKKFQLRDKTDTGIFLIRFTNIFKFYNFFLLNFIYFFNLEKDMART